MSQRREKCGASVNIARGWCPRQWTSHGNNTNIPTTPQHVKHLVILPAYLNANPGRKGQERLKESKCPLTKRHRHAPGADHLEKSIIDPL